MNDEVTRPILWSVPLASSARPPGWMLQPRIVETAGVFGFPDCLRTMREVR